VGKEVKYVVRLTDEERQSLVAMLTDRRVAQGKALRARMLLKADAAGPAWSDAQIAAAFVVTESTVHRLRQRLVEEGLEQALSRKPHARTKPRKLDGVQEARLIATACSQAPEGRARWTVKLLADRIVQLQVVDNICPETVRRTLKKTNSSHGCGNNG
jgi:transposase